MTHALRIAHGRCSRLSAAILVSLTVTAWLPEPSRAQIPGRETEARSVNLDDFKADRHEVAVFLYRHDSLENFVAMTPDIDALIERSRRRDRRVIFLLERAAIPLAGEAVAMFEDLYPLWDKERIVENRSYRKSFGKYYESARQLENLMWNSERHREALLESIDWRSAGEELRYFVKWLEAEDYEVEVRFEISPLDVVVDQVRRSYIEKRPITFELLTDWVRGRDRGTLAEIEEILSASEKPVTLIVLRGAGHLPLLRGLRKLEAAKGSRLRVRSNYSLAILEEAEKEWRRNWPAYPDEERARRSRDLRFLIPGAGVVLLAGLFILLRLRMLRGEKLRGRRRRYRLAAPSRDHQTDPLAPEPRSHPHLEDSR